uniref:RING-type domain-containing protein n=1 Tax=Palpitomonas bilix TaxID=652834 RepID=A0A7S3LWU0_9EUKA
MRGRGGRHGENSGSMHEDVLSSDVNERLQKDKKKVKETLSAIVEKMRKLKDHPLFHCRFAAEKAELRGVLASLDEIEGEERQWLDRAREAQVEVLLRANSRVVVTAIERMTSSLSGRPLTATGERRAKELMAKRAKQAVNAIGFLKQETYNGLVRLADTFMSLSVEERKVCDASEDLLGLLWLTESREGRTTEDIRRSLCDIADSFRDISRFFRSMGETLQSLADSSFHKGTVSVSQSGQAATPEEALKAVSALTSLNTKASGLAASLRDSSDKRAIHTWAEREEGVGNDGERVVMESQKLRVEDGEEEDRLCVICQTAQSTITLVPCGHLCLCEACCEEGQIDLCPLCRQEVIIRQKTFLS